jgi:hypothetical protein
MPSAVLENTPRVEVALKQLSHFAVFERLIPKLRGISLPPKSHPKWLRRSGFATDYVQ